MKVKMKIGDIKYDEQLIEMRPINKFFVNRYRQVLRTEKTLGTLIVDKKTKCFVSGNHRGTAYLEEFGPDHIIEVEALSFKSRRAVLTKFVEENVIHGNPLSGITRRSVALALQEEGAAPNFIANLLGISVARIQVWAGMTVVELGEDNVSRIKPAKRGMTPGKTVNPEQYTTHIQKDRGLTIFSQAEQITRWLKDDWINMDCKRTVQSLVDLQTELNKFLKMKKAA